MAGKAAIIGGGVIGGGWAARFLLMGWDVAFHDPSPDALARFERVLKQARYALPMLYETRLPPEGRLTQARSIAEAVSGADYVQESVPERLDLKQAVYREILAANSDAPVASSTSGFKPGDLRAGLMGGDRILVAHPFNPAYLLPLVEVVGGAGVAPEILAETETILTALGMRPLMISAEIDGHIADRLLEAVWREALWLINDGVATTEDIDEAIRLGFGLRWAQMGLFETYRIAGGDGGMAHFLEQFGPALKWPWTKLTDVPDLTDALIDRIARQSDAQSGRFSISELETQRDENLVAILRALKARQAGAGRVLTAHESGLDMPDPEAMLTVERSIPLDWTDYNGHMNESRYGQIFSDASDAVLAAIGAGPAYVADGLSFFTAEVNIRYLEETHAGEIVRVESRITLAEGKKLGMAHEMRRARDGALLATATQFMVHVSLETRKSCAPRPDVSERSAELAARHAKAGGFGADRS